MPTPSTSTATGRPTTGVRRRITLRTDALWYHVSHARPALIIVWHCCGSLVESNEAPGAEDLGRLYASAAGIAYVDEWTDYPITGQLIDAAQRLGIPAMDVELAEPDRADAATHRAAVQAVLDTLEVRE
jgi:hypothetical protein